MPLKEMLGYTAGVRISGCVRKLLVLAEDYQRCPLFKTGEFLHLEAHEWIHPHPIDLLSHCRIAIEASIGEVDMDRDDVRLLVHSTREASDACARKHRLALAVRHFLNYHALSHRRVNKRARSRTS
jgi:hypothetical protein